MIIQILQCIIWGMLIAKICTSYDGIVLVSRYIYANEKKWRVAERIILCLLPHSFYLHLLPVELALNICLTGISFAIFFDWYLNIILDRPIWYVGSQSLTENFFRNKGKLLFLLKLIGLIVCITLKFII